MEALLKRRDLTLEQLHTYGHGPSLSPMDIARLTGGSWTAEKVRNDIDAGNLTASRHKCGPRRFYFRVEWREAQRYLRMHGYLHAA
jgi:hypothetical protein